jgi:replication-associated recombination protein RarA
MVLGLQRRQLIKDSYEMKFIPKERSLKAATIVIKEGSNRPSWNLSKSPYGINLGEATSAVIKCIRTNEWRTACWFAHQLFISGKEAEEWIWLHLRSHCIEDIGLAAPEAINIISNLEITYFKCMERSERRWLVGFGAVRYLCSLPKDRSNDEAYARMIIELRENITDYPNIPDRALDCHTESGKKLNRGKVHFFTEAAKINNEVNSETKDDFDFLLKRAELFDKQEK